MTTFGTLTGDPVTNSRGDVQAGVALGLYATQADATAPTGLLATVTTDAEGRWAYTDASRAVVWVRTPTGRVYSTYASDATGATDVAVAVLVGDPASATRVSLSTTYGRKGAGTDAVLYVSPTGDPANDGLSPGAALSDLAAAVAALPTGGGTIILSAGTHNITTIAERNGVTLRGAGREVTKLRIASGSMLAPTGAIHGWVFEGLDIAVSTSGSHMIDLGATGGLYFTKFVDCVLTTNVAGASLVHQSGAGNFLENLWFNCDMYRLASATVPAFDIVNTAGGANANVWKRCRISSNNNVTAPAWRIEASVTGTYAYDNSWEDIVGEQNAGGLIALYSVNGATFKNVVDWDAAVNYAADVIFVGKSATSTYNSMNIIAENAGRRGGTLGAGTFDFNAGSSSSGTTRVVLINVGNQTSTPVVQSNPASTFYAFSSATAGHRVSMGAIFDAYSAGDAVKVSPVYASGRGLNLQEGVTGYAGYVLHARKFADTGDHMVMDGNGTFQWGAGAGTFDTALKRGAAGVLQAQQKLTAIGGLGVGNSAAATTPGSVVKKIEIFDAAGVSLGFIPVYSTIT